MHLARAAPARVALLGTAAEIVAAAVTAEIVATERLAVARGHAYRRADAVDGELLLGVHRRHTRIDGSTTSTDAKVNGGVRRRVGYHGEGPEATV